MELDPSIHHGTVKPQKLLKNDGSVVTQIVESVRRAAQGYASRNASFAGGARVLTARSFLTACETVPGQYSNSQRNFFDYVARWIDARF